MSDRAPMCQGCSALTPLCGGVVRPFWLTCPIIVACCPIVLAPCPIIVACCPIVLAKFWLGLQDDFDIEAEEQLKSKELESIAYYQSNAA
jgi:hypothetical protein